MTARGRERRRRRGACDAELPSDEAGARTIISTFVKGAGGILIATISRSGIQNVFVM